MPVLPFIAPIEAPSIATQERRAIVVAGVNYPRESQGYGLPRGVPDRTYRRLAHQYADWAFKNGITRVFIFDFLEGQLIERLKGSASEKKGEVVKPSHQPLQDGNYRTWRKIDDKWKLVLKPHKGESMAYWPGLHKFTAHHGLGSNKDVPFSDYWEKHLDWARQEGSLSVSDVYKFIVNCPTASLQDLHFLGHAVTGGPIIVNTWAGNRDLNYSEFSKTFDKDCRARDFSGTIPPNSGGFKAAFAQDATIGIWGCDSNNRFKSETLVPAMEEWRKSKTLSTSLRAQIDASLAATYATAMAKHVGRPVRAALPGTYASHDGVSAEDQKATGLAFPASLMHVNFKDCEGILRFYADALGSSFPKTGLYQGHPTFGRGYAVYLP